MLAPMAVPMWVPGSFPGMPPRQMFVCELGCLITDDKVADHLNRAHPGA